MCSNGLIGAIATKSEGGRGKRDSVVSAAPFPGRAYSEYTDHDAGGVRDLPRVGVRGQNKPFGPRKKRKGDGQTLGAFGIILVSKNLT